MGRRRGRGLTGRRCISRNRFGGFSSKRKCAINLYMAMSPNRDPLPGSSTPPVTRAPSKWGHISLETRRDRVTSSMWEPHTDFSESESDFHIQIDLPGVAREHIDLAVRDQVLTVTGERVYDPRREDREIHRSERVYGRFSRTITLPLPVSEQDITASYDNGVLTITLSKRRIQAERHISPE